MTPERWCRGSTHRWHSCLKLRWSSVWVHVTIQDGDIQVRVKWSWSQTDIVYFATTLNKKQNKTQNKQTNKTSGCFSWNMVWVLQESHPNILMCMKGACTVDNGSVQLAPVPLPPRVLKRQNYQTYWILIIISIHAKKKKKQMSVDDTSCATSEGAHTSYSDHTTLLTAREF